MLMCFVPDIHLIFLQLGSLSFQYQKIGSIFQQLVLTTWLDLRHFIDFQLVDKCSSRQFVTNYESQ